MSHIATFTGGPLDGTSQVRPEEQAAAYLLTEDHALIWIADLGARGQPIGTYAYASGVGDGERAVVAYEWQDHDGASDVIASTDGNTNTVNAMMDRLIAVARRNEAEAEPITTYESTGGPGNQPVWKIGYRDRVSVSRRVARGPTLEATLRAWLADYE